MLCILNILHELYFVTFPKTLFSFFNGLVVSVKHVVLIFLSGIRHCYVQFVLHPSISYDWSIPVNFVCYFLLLLTIISYISLGEI
jgi:hypothetical protein